MRAHAKPVERGYTLLELLVVGFLLIVLAAIAVPMLVPAKKTSDLELAVAQAKRVITDRMSTARTGPEQQFSIYAVEGIPASVEAGTIRTIGTPSELPAPETITFASGTAYPVMDGRPQSVAMVLREREDYQHAAALVIWSSGTVERFDWRGGEGWQRRD